MTALHWTQIPDIYTTQTRVSLALCSLWNWLVASWLPSCLSGCAALALVWLV